MAIFPITQVPLTIGGLVGWWDANDPSANGSHPSNNATISTFSDKSGNQNNATQATGSKQPLFKTNMQAGLPAIQFDGVDDFMTTANTLTVADHNIFMVYKILTFADKRSLYWYNGSGQGFYFNNDSLPTALDFLSPVLTLTELAQTTGFYITEHVRNSTTATLYKNAVSQQSGTCNAANISSPIYFAADFTGGQNGNIDLCELLVYSRALSSTDRATINNYLKNKWGIA